MNCMNKHSVAGHEEAKQSRKYDKSNKKSYSVSGRRNAGKDCLLQQTTPTVQKSPRKVCLHLIKIEEEKRKKETKIVFFNKQLQQFKMVCLCIHYMLQLNNCFFFFINLHEICFDSQTNGVDETY